MTDGAKAEQRSSASRSTPLGVYDRPTPTAVTGIEVTAVLLSVLWLLGSAVFFLLLPEEAAAGVDVLRAAMAAMAVGLPVAMIWVAATAARASRVMREESERLQTAIDAIRQAHITQSQSGGMAHDSALARRLGELARSQHRTEAALAALAALAERDARPAPDTPAASPPPPDLRPAAEHQPALALGTTAADHGPPLAATDFIRALNFPDTAEDREGFAALRRALRDRSAGQLIQAAQDVLTLLSQDGIYMDDLLPDRARPEIWRDFAHGTRGKAVSSLGGIRDRSSLERAGARMKRDPIFRDAAHHFLRRFDRTFASFEPAATDAEISALSDTRTARAFMLLGRVAGTFD